MIFMEFKDWMMQKFLEWEKTQNGRKSYSDFARYLDVKIPTYAQWRAGNNPPSLDMAKKLSEKLGNEIFGILGYTVPGEESPRSALLAAGFPPEIIDPVLSAQSEYTAILDSKGIMKDSPEAREIVRAAFARHGIQFTETK